MERNLSLGDGLEQEREQRLADCVTAQSKVAAFHGKIDRHRPLWSQMLQLLAEKALHHLLHSSVAIIKHTILDLRCLLREQKVSKEATAAFDGSYGVSRI